VPALGKAGEFSHRTPALPSADMALGKAFLKKNKKSLSSACTVSTRQSIYFFKKINLCRVPAMSALGKEAVRLTVDVSFADC
jgi:hypothetical protein